MYGNSKLISSNNTNEAHAGSETPWAQKHTNVALSRRLDSLEAETNEAYDYIMGVTCKQVSKVSDLTKLLTLAAILHKPLSFQS